jgi:hypothetical protein
MNRKVKLLLLKVFVVFHLGCMLFYTGRILEILPSHRAFKPVRSAVIMYSKVTMTNYRFAFFAPFIPETYTIKIYGETLEGGVKEFRLPVPNREIEIRYNRMIRNIEEDRLRERMFRSIAGYVKLRNPEVDSVNIQVFKTTTPTMAEFRAGERQVIQPAYNLKF